MKKISAGGKRLMKIIFTFSFIVALSACKKEEIKEEIQEELAIEIPVQLNVSNANLRTDIFTVSFSATAAIQYCWGENVRFYGTIENKVNSTIDANGVVHYTRHWTLKGLDAVGVPSGTSYSVIAGAEMFTVIDPVFNSGGIPQAGSSGMVFIHQGTVVLEKTLTGERVIARHVIKKDPQTGVVTSGWFCMGK